MDTKFISMVTYVHVLSTNKSKDPLMIWSLKNSRDKLKPLYLHQHSAYGYQILIKLWSLALARSRHKLEP